MTFNNKLVPPSAKTVSTSHDKGVVAKHPVDAAHTDKPMSEKPMSEKPMSEKAKVDKLSADKTHGDKKHEAGHMPQASKSER